MPSDQSQTAPTQLLRRLSLVHAVLYGLGVTIGAGIYVLVGVAAGRSGMHAPLAFALAAIVMGLSAASFAELGTRMPVSASEAAYVDRAFHRPWLSLATGLLVIITAVISASTISSGSAGYVQTFLPFDRGWIITGVVIAMGLVSCLATIHSVTFAGLMTLVEVAGLVLIVGAGVWNGTGLLTRLPEIWPGGDLGGWLGVASTTMIAVFAFIGFEHLVNVAEEMKAPRRTLPAALFLTLGLTAVIYGLVVWVSITAVPPSELAVSNAPLALVFERLTGWPPSSLSVIAIVATLNGVIVHMIMIARVIYGLAQQGNLPPVLGRVNGMTGTPLIATGIGVTLILFFSTALPLEGLAELTSQGTLVLFAIVNLALIRIKWREASPPADVFVCPKWIPYAGLAASLLLLVFDSLPLS